MFRPASEVFADPSQYSGEQGAGYSQQPSSPASPPPALPRDREVIASSVHNVRVAGHYYARRDLFKSHGDGMAVLHELEKRLRESPRLAVGPDPQDGFPHALGVFLCDNVVDEERFRLGFLPDKLALALYELDEFVAGTARILFAYFLTALQGAMRWW